MAQHPGIGGKRDTLIGKLRARNHAMLDEVDAVTLIDGAARFVGPRDVEVTAGEDRLRVRAQTVVINTGTTPVRPSIQGAEGSRMYDSTSLQYVDPRPERLAIIGGEFAGLEFAGMFSHFGSQVTVINRGTGLLAGEDDDVAAATTPGLGLEEVGIATDDQRFIKVDERLRTSVPGVYAVGDINGGPQFTYISLDDNRIVMDEIAGEGRRTTTDRVAVPRTTFLTPPLAQVGINERDARGLGRPVLVAKKNIADIAAMPRPKIVGETHGLIKVLVDAETDQILGATLFCIDAQEVINLVALAMRAGVTATALRDGIWTHPSSTEALNEMLGGLRPLDEATT